MQLTFAFETLNLLRVSFKTHIANQRSQAAIRAIGGVYEGTFRNHLLMPDGSQRDSAWFSITNKDWPEVKDMLTRRLKVHRSRSLRPAMKQQIVEFRRSPDYQKCSKSKSAGNQCTPMPIGPTALSAMHEPWRQTPSFVPARLESTPVKNRE